MLFLAVDFDKEGWREDACAFLETCGAMGLPAVLERSRSGRGGYVWLFFEEAITAASARRLGSFVLTETMERRPDIGFGSYDRFFPNQDTLPQGGLGNSIALPSKSSHETWGTAFSWTIRWFPMKISGRFCHRCRGLAEPQLKTLCAMLNGEGVPLAPDLRRHAVEALRTVFRAGENPVGDRAPDTPVAIIEIC